MFDRQDINKDDLLRLVMLYALRYEEGGSELENFVDMLFQRGFDAEQAGVCALPRVLHT